MEVGAVQVWLDRPGVEDDPALRAYLVRRGEEGLVALMRTSPVSGYVLIAPPMTDDGQWHRHDTPPRGRTHTAAEIWQVNARLAQGGADASA